MELRARRLMAGAALTPVALLALQAALAPAASAATLRAVAAHPHPVEAAHAQRPQGGPVVAVAPGVAGAGCRGGRLVRAAITIPAERGVRYALDGARVGAGSYPARPGAHLVVAAGSTVVLRGRTSFRVVVPNTQPRCRQLVSAIAPSVSAAKCSGSSGTAGRLSMPSTPGVRYTVTPSPGHAAGPSVVVTATALPGYRFAPDSRGAWSSAGARRRTLVVTYAAAPTCRSRTTAPPTSPAAACQRRGTAPGTSTGSTCPAAPVVASASRPRAAAGSARYVGTRALATTSGSIVPQSAGFHDDVCNSSTGLATGASYTIPSTTGVFYWLDAAHLRPGTYPATDGSTVTIVASAAKPYTLSGITQWTHTFGDAPTCNGSTPARTGSTGSTTGASAPPRTASGDTPAFTGAPVEPVLLTALLLLLTGGGLTAAARRRVPPAQTPVAGSGRTPPRPDPAMGLVAFRPAPMTGRPGPARNLLRSARRTGTCPPHAHPPPAP